MDPDSVPCRMCSWIPFLLHSWQLVPLPFYRGISSRVTHVEGSRQVELFPGFHKWIYKLRVRPLVDLGSSSHAIPFSDWCCSREKDTMQLGCWLQHMGVYEKRSIIKPFWHQPTIVAPWNKRHVRTAPSKSQAWSTWQEYMFPDPTVHTNAMGIGVRCFTYITKVQGWYTPKPWVTLPRLAFQQMCQYWTASVWESRQCVNG